MKKQDNIFVFDKELMEPLFWLLEETKGVTQLEKHHPEGDVFTHSLQVLHHAFRESIDTDLILAAMLHDVGKIGDPKRHEKIAHDLLSEHVSAKTMFLIENHMRVWTYLLGEMRKKKKVLEIYNHPWLPELTLLARWDKMGRNPRMKVRYDKEKIIDKLNRCVEQKFKEANREISR